jgi:hypothetical protein
MDPHPARHDSRRFAPTGISILSPQYSGATTLNDHPHPSQ